MGAWGTDHFANDDAMDWVADLEAATDATLLHDALDSALEDDEYIEAPVGSVSLAAAEVVAALRGKPRTELPPEVTGWVSSARKVDAAPLLEKARKAVRLVGEDTERSELRQLWDEAAEEDAAAWRDAVSDLKKRLA